MGYVSGHIRDGVIVAPYRRENKRGAALADRSFAAASDSVTPDPFEDSRGVYLITADTLREGRVNTNWYVQGDSGAIFDTFSSNGGVYAEGAKTGALMRVLRTGKKADRHGMIRVKMQIAQDLGNQEGTLGFSDQKMFRGQAPACLFED